MAGKDRSSIKDEATYDALREDGASKEKAARIANAQADPEREPSAKAGAQPPYEEWSVEELQERARELGVDGRSAMAKDELILAIRNH